jgi:hypothetical protein
MWWVVEMMVVTAIFLPAELFVQQADKDVHISSWLPDLRKPSIRERML